MMLMSPPMQLSTMPTIPPMTCPRVTACTPRIKPKIGKT